MKIETVFCGQCGESIVATARFCNECGTAQEQFAMALVADPTALSQGPTVVVAANSVELKPIIEPEPDPIPKPVAKPDLAPISEPAPVPIAKPDREPIAKPVPEPEPVPDIALFCGQCGRQFTTDARFCGGCGAPRGEAPDAMTARPAPATSGPPPRAATGQPTHSVPSPAAAAYARVSELQQSLPAPLRKVPAELLVICALMAIAGGLLLVWALIAIGPIVDGFTEAAALSGEVASLVRAFAIFALVLWIIVTLFGSACVYLAWRMVHADRVARGLSYVLLGAVAASILLGDDHGTELVLAMLACLAGIAALAFSPRVNEFFLGDGAPDRGQPAPVVVARTLLAAWAGCALLLGVAFLPLGDFGGEWVVVGFVLLGLGVGAWYLSGRIADGDATARMLVTVGAVIYVIALLILDQRATGLLLPLALGAGILWNLWSPQASRRHFGTDLAAI